jgi:hypothetical protein
MFSSLKTFEQYSEFDNDSFYNKLKLVEPTLLSIEVYKFVVCGSIINNIIIDNHNVFLKDFELLLKMYSIDQSTSKLSHAFTVVN